MPWAHTEGSARLFSERAGVCTAPPSVRLGVNTGLPGPVSLALESQFHREKWKGPVCVPRGG